MAPFGLKTKNCEIETRFLGTNIFLKSMDFRESMLECMRRKNIMIDI